MLRFGIGLVLFLLVHVSSQAAVLRIAAASDLRFALEKILAAPELKSLDAEVVYGSSGMFAQQILSGAPFDVFLAADDSFTQKICAAHRCDGQPFRYGTGRLVLWAPKSAGLRLPRDGQLGFLRDSAVKRIAIANPTHAPYGRLAEEALKRAGLLPELRSRLVTAEGVSQAAQFARTGAANVGLVAKSLASAAEMAKEGDFVEVSPELVPVLPATGLILKGVKHKSSAERLQIFLLSESGQHMLAAFGLDLKK